MSIKNTPTVIVNATAMKHGGALTVLHQFLKSANNDGSDFLIFIDHSHNFDELYTNLKFFKVNTRTFLSRILWDYFGFKRHLKKYEIIPNVIISLQNTTVRHNHQCPQVVYLHQPLPFSSKRWNIFKKDERLLFFYKYFYSYFIFIHFNKHKDHFIVQSDWLKNKLIKSYAMSSDFIHVSTPIVSLGCDSERLNVEKIDSDIFQFVFPASPIIYKNHMEIVNAIVFLKKSNKLNKDFKIIFTINESDLPNLYHKLVNENLLGYFEFKGHLSKGELNNLYGNSNALLFPSYIETFGLPLIEAASFGLQIIVSDEPYSREVIGDYKGASFIHKNSPEQWGKQIDKLINEIESERYNFKFSQKGNGMDDVINLLIKVGT
ncbi:glycosyltransferase [Shewanella sp. KX20019]|uniref:glycosyltransferase n=1 Tax=Shewanella sp. KX20019 TaxID=2803864 RepID=UPI00192724FB|nr:glycosyltransferase [Shewanella sp. KX20019]QQX81808.1 glycosyltransferase [Shewanella sp. KX20019]